MPNPSPIPSKKWHFAVVFILGGLISAALVIGLFRDSNQNKKQVESQVPPAPGIDELLRELERQRMEAEMRARAAEAQRDQALSTPNQPSRPAPPPPRPQEDPEDLARKLQIAASPIIAASGESRMPSDKNTFGQPSSEQELSQTQDDRPEYLKNPTLARGNAMSSWLSETESFSSREISLALKSGPEPWVLHEGSVNPAVLVTRANSDTPGMLVARVLRDVYDSKTGKVLLVHKGSRVIGQYMNAVLEGQERLLVAFHRLVYPSGAEVWLGGSTGVEGLGESGLKDKVYTHFWKMYGSALLVAAISFGVDYWENQDTTNIYVGSNSDPAREAGGAAGRVLEDVAQSILQRKQDIPPTIVIREGHRFNIMVNRDLVLNPVETTPLIQRRSGQP
jgi:type IV secretory pathway VirB10-like protein